MRLLITIILLVTAPLLRAQVHFSSIDELLEYADKNSLVIQKGKNQQRSAQQSTAISKSNLQPKVNFFGTSDYNVIVPSQVVPAALLGGQQGKFTSVQFGMPLALSTGVELQFPIVNFSLLEAVKTSKLREQSASYKAEADKELLHINLIQLYYQHLFLQKLLEITQLNQNSLDELLRAMQLRFNNGIVHPADLNRMKKLTLDNKTAGINYQQQLQQNDIALHASLNVDDGVPIVIKEILPSNKKAALTGTMEILERPGFKIAESEVLIAQQQVNEAKKAPYPKINFTSRYVYQFQKNDQSSLHFDAATVGLRLDVPLFAGRLFQKQKQQAYTSLEAAKNNEQIIKAQLQQQTNEWQVRYNNAIKKSNLLQQKFDLSEENLRIATLNLKEGIMEYDSFNNIYIEYNQAQTELLQNLADATIYQLLLTKKL